ncbi:MAG TPA: hypothetical protein VIV59_12640 [Anaeromyxobacteraceae bacterium]
MRETSTTGAVEAPPGAPALIAGARPAPPTLPAGASGRPARPHQGQ